MRGLGELEALIMDRLWSADGSQSVRQVLESLPRDRERAYTTVMTVLDHLHRKGLLERERVGRAYLYCTVQSREEYTAGLMGDALAAGGDRTAALMHFVGQLAPEEAEQLLTLLAKAEHSSRGAGLPKG